MEQNLISESKKELITYTTTESNKQITNTLNTIDSPNKNTNSIKIKKIPETETEKNPNKKNKESVEEIQNKLSIIKKEIITIKENKNPKAQENLKHFENIFYKLSIKLEFAFVDEKFKSINFPSKLNSRKFEEMKIEKQFLKNLIPMEKENYSFEDNSNNGSVIKNINSNSEIEFNLIGVITCEFNKEIFYATGFFISENAVMTCAHNVINANKKIAKNLKFHFNNNNNDNKDKEKDNKIKTINVKKIHIPEEFLSDPINSLEDYCLLILEDKIDNGYFGISSELNNSINNSNYFNYIFSFNLFREKQYLTCGFPANLITKNSLNLFQQVIKNLEIYVNTNEIKYKNLTNPIGLSGSPIYFTTGKESFIIGIHSRNDNNNSYAVHLTQKRTQVLQKWLLEEKKILINLMYSKISHEEILLVTPYDLNSLKVIILNNNNLCEKSMESFSNLQIKFLEKLNLDNNNIRSKGIKNLLQVKFKFFYLKEFYISGNNIDNEVITYLKEFDFFNLEKLFLMRNLISGNNSNNDNDNNITGLSRIKAKKNLEIDLSDNKDLDKECAENVNKDNYLIKVFV